MTQENKSFISALVSPGPGSASGKKSWSIDVETVLVPFFTATNAMGDTQLSPETLGAPIRLGIQKDGSVRFTQTGRPSMRIAPELTQQVKILRENLTASLVAYTGEVIEEHGDAYREQVERNQLAGSPLLDQDAKMLQDEYDRQQRVAEQEALEASKPTTGRRASRPAPEEQTPVDPALAEAATG